MEASLVIDRAAVGGGERKRARHAAWLAWGLINSLVLPGATFAQSVGSAAFSYDAAGRLASAAYPTGVCVSYSYDANGNQITRSVITAVAAGSLVWDTGRWNCALWALNEGVRDMLRRNTALAAATPPPSPRPGAAQDATASRTAGR
jgi:YD repeat-containing protein